MKRGRSAQRTPSTPKKPEKPAPVPNRGRQRWLLLGTVLLAAGASIWWFWPSTPPAIPPIVADVQDADVLRALDTARQKVQNDPSSAAAWGELGMTLLAHQYEAEADRCFAEAARLDAGDASWPYYRGLYAMRYDPDKAVGFLRQAMAGRCASEHKSALRLRLAEELLEREELVEAEKLFRQDWQGQSRDPRAAFGLGLIALARGEEKLAEEMFIAARVSPTARKPATAHLAVLARKRGDEVAAAGFEQEAVAISSKIRGWPDPFVDQALRLQVGLQKRLSDLAQIEERRGFAEAAQSYLREIEQRPTPYAYLHAGLNLARMEQFDRALPLLREAVRRDPDNCESHMGLAQALYTQAEKMRKTSPDSADAKKSFREAADAARLATERKPNYAAAYLLWGSALMQLGEPDAAVGPLKKGVACRPELFHLQLALGEAFSQTNAFLEAETHLENARKLAPNDPRADLALARLPKKKD